jgi:GntR family transcriptional repressor for pyruvate dehydrogenase complex
MQFTAFDVATAALRNLIARGQYQPGDRLPSERELADALALSRPTLREAIRRLTEAGLLEPRRGSGTYVADVDIESVFAVRLQLEPYAAGEAARNRSAEDAHRLAALVKDLSRTIDDPEAFVAADVEIHRTIADASSNRLLAGILDRLTELMQLSRAITSPESAARRATLRDLRALERAVRRHDEGGAAQAMRRHLESVRDITAHRRPPDRRLDSLSAPPSSAVYPTVVGAGKERR